MSQATVFISYSRQDEKELAEFKPWLEVLQREGLAQVFVDTDNIDVGDDFLQEIEGALSQTTVAVLFVSIAFRSSKFINNHELPAIFKGYQEGRLKILPVFLKPFGGDDWPFAWTDPETGGKHAFDLTRINGVGRPDHLLVEMSWSDRQRSFERLSLRIRELAEEAADAGLQPAPSLSVSGSPPPPSTPAPSPGGAGFTLIVHLERSGQTLQVNCHLPDQEAFHQRSGAAIPDEVGAYLEALEADDDERKKDLLSSRRFGRNLFLTLFGGEADWEPVFRTLFQMPGGPRPNPIRHPVTLRICSADRALLRLPWRKTAWEAERLMAHHWVFKPGTDCQADHDPRTPAPCEVLVIAPRFAQGEETHLAALRDIFNQVWPMADPPWLSVVSTYEQLETRLQRGCPHFIYVYGRQGYQDGRVVLFLEDGQGGTDPLETGDLAGLLRDSDGGPPAILYLNVQGPSGFQSFTDFIPLVLERGLRDWDGAAASLAIVWLKRWLGQREDPLEALHRVLRPMRRVGPQEETLAPHGNYRDWAVDLYREGAGRPDFRLRLDRESQKGLLAKWVGEMVSSNELRVMALVPYAAPGGNGLALFPAQIAHHLEDALSDRVAVKVISLQFPESRANLRRDLEHELDIQLGRLPGEAVAAMLERQLVAVDPRLRPVLILDWGVFGSEEGLQAPLTSEEIRAWLDFASDYLTRRCPRTMKLVCFAGLETRKNHHKRLQELLVGMNAELDNPAFMLHILKPLDRVEDFELINFLKLQGCPTGLRKELTPRLIEASHDGVFEELIELLRVAEEGSWYDLLGKLRRDQGAAPPPESEEPFV